eukprot:82131-Pyramimonas_sp.AAC.1
MPLGHASCGFAVRGHRQVHLDLDLAQEELHASLEPRPTPRRRTPTRHCSRPEWPGWPSNTPRCGCQT